ncbi:hypothetical protein F4779DRAFT_637312 [Xylariaceae sp. FL0662B]|nr:hypothetical protein F4779DRAFT_637312 [Xylariaceae sp. FL0662B]
MASESSNTNSNPNPNPGPFETSTFSPPEFVNLAQLELETRANPTYQAPRKFSLPSPLPPKPQDTDATSDKSQDTLGPAESSPVQTPKEKEKGNDDSCSPDEFWYESGKVWSVKPDGETKSREDGLSACASGPDCGTCGEPLDLDEIMGFVPCETCGCFN